VAQDEQPNILFVMADQLAAHALRPYGNEVVQAPAIDALAETGVVFERAYCNSPLCAPSRASLVTGQLPSVIGTYDNACELPASVPTMAHYLRLLGYRTCLAGKMHFVGPDQLHGFEERLTTDVYPAGLDWVPDWTSPVHERLPWYHDMSSVVEAGISEATLQLDYDEEVAFRTVRKIYDLARDSEGRPFFLVCSFAHPHDPYEAPRAFWDRYDPSEIDLPAVPDPAADPHSRRIAAMCGTDDLELDEERVRAARHGYYAAVSYVDAKLSELMLALEATGLRDRTVVVFGSDHGDMLGERGLWYKMSFFEASARVPLIVNAPQRLGAGRVADNVSLVDLLPTFLDLAGGGNVEVVEPLAGTSLLPLVSSGAPAGRTVVGEYLAEGTNAPAIMLCREGFKYVHCPGDPDLLFDLDADPHELENLAESRPDVAAAFRAELEARFDLGALTDEVLSSQRRRRLVSRALSVGAQTAWDYRPQDDSSRRYIRGEDFWEPFGPARLRHD
jgi:choline-sulfatase